MSASRSARRRSGLTLIELVVALTITGMALAAGYGALSWMNETRQRTEVATRAAWRAAAIRRGITRWLAGATLAVAPDVAEFRGVDGERRGEHDDVISFRTTAATPLGTAETDVTLLIVRGDSTPERGLVARFVEPHGTRHASLELDSQAVSLEARYLSGLSGGAQWTNSWISSSVLPRGVELVVAGARGESLPPLLALPIVVPFASGT